MNGRRTRLKEEEIVDVLLGKAEPDLEARVKRIVTTDELDARIHARWDGTIEQARALAVPLREAVQRISRNVMDRIHEESSEPLTDIVAPVEGWYNRALALVIGGPDRSTLRVALPAVAFSFVVLACIGVLTIWSHSVALQTVTLARAYGNVHAVRSGNADEAVLLRSGDRLRTPVQFRLAAGAQCNVTLPGGNTFVSVAAPASVDVLSAWNVRQDAGRISYRVTHDPKSPFNVDVPQGRIVDLGTVFEVTVSPGEATLVEVVTGRVRLEPRLGNSIVMKEGQRGLLTEQGVEMEGIVPQDSALAPRPFPTASPHRHLPPPQAQEFILDARVANFSGLTLACVRAETEGEDPG